MCHADGCCACVQLSCVCLYLFLSCSHEHVHCNRQHVHAHAHTHTHAHVIALPEDYINDLLVSLLISSHRWYEFHQFLQYHVLTDSLLIANRLLTLSSSYPPAYQLALDMLYRLGASVRLLHVLLQQQQVVTALRLLPKNSTFFTRQVSACHVLVMCCRDEII